MHITRLAFSSFNVLILHRFKPNEGVIVIGATNFAEALDKYVYSG